MVFIQSFSNQWPLKALYDTASHSPVHTHIHSLTAESATQGDLLSHMPPHIIILALYQSVRWKLGKSQIGFVDSFDNVD